MGYTCSDNLSINFTEQEISCLNKKQHTTMIRILVTGAAGNIGSALVQQLLQYPEYHVVGIDNFLTGRKSKLPIEKTPILNSLKLMSITTTRSAA